MTKKEKYRTWWWRNTSAGTYDNSMEYKKFTTLKSAKMHIKLLEKKDLKDKSVTSNAGGIQKIDKDGDWEDIED